MMAYSPWPQLQSRPTPTIADVARTDEDCLAVIRARLAGGERPTCPECGERCFVPRVGWRTEQGIYWFCTDMGHWTGGYEEAVWKPAETNPGD